MNIMYQYPIGQLNPHLFPRFKKTFEENGHYETTNPHEATHCFINILSGGCVYNEEALRIVKDRGITIVMFDCREYGTMSGKTFSGHELNPDIYFVRNMNIGNTHANAYPYDWPYFPGYDFEPTIKEELYSRPYDCCMIAVETPTRRKVVNQILADGRLKLNFKFLDHTQRLPHSEWISEHRKAKLFMSCDGGGFTNERPNQLFSIATMLKNISNHLPANPFEDGINCLTIVSQDDIEKIVNVLEHKDWLYDIYLKGVEFTKTKLSEESVSKYVLNILNQNCMT